MAAVYQTRTIEGHEIAFRRTGGGEPMLLVHGITTWSFIWEGLLEALAAHHDVVAVDLLGCGRSAKPLDASYALKDHARRMALLVDALGLGPVHYVGHDLGGGIGQILAVRNPEKVRTLTMVNTVAYDFWPVQPIIALRTPVVRWFLMASFDVGTFRLVVRRGLFHKERLTPELFEKYQEPLRTEAGRRALLHFARCLDNTNLTEIAGDLRRIAVPATVVWGTRDVYLSPAIAEKLAANIPGCRLVEIETAGHYVPIDEPARLAQIVLEAARGRRA
jgi:pimeloyl-ACP methyl ester carboxylesterase